MTKKFSIALVFYLSLISWSCGVKLPPVAPSIPQTPQEIENQETAKNKKIAMSHLN